MANDSDFVLYNVEDANDDGVIVAISASSKIYILPSPDAKAMESILKSSKSQWIPKKTSYP